ncbi:universal stress protein [Lutibacter sp.]|uniref:universal stress protein n=1 Tax=Lutibacter sp. TaxID=1925666 RepID=UPI0035650D15
MKNILLPTDFSDNSWNAINYAIQFYKNTPCNFYILHVTLMPTYIGGEIPIFPSTNILETTVLKQAKIELTKLLKKIKKTDKNPDHHFFSISKYDFFIDAVKTQIEEKNIDLIIMGTKGATGFNEVVVGTNTGDLITKIKCPVLIIPEKSTFSPPKEIAFPTDFHNFYQPFILNNISEFAEMYNSSVRLVHVAKKDEVLTGNQLENKHYLHNYFTENKHSFHRITSNNIEDGVRCFVESRDIDIIIMIAKNLTFFQRILFKPTVEEISYHTKVPFLVLHEE